MRVSLDSALKRGLGDVCTAQGLVMNGDVCVSQADLNLAAAAQIQSNQVSQLIAQSQANAVTGTPTYFTSLPAASAPAASVSVASDTSSSTFLMIAVAAAAAYFFVANK